jgi:hypothetical protein
MLQIRTHTEAQRGPIKATLVGVWTLQKYSAITEGLPPRYPFGLKPHGQLIYTSDGFVSAMLMAPDRPKLSGNSLTDGTPDEYIAAGQGFIGYSGVYEVDEARSVVTHRPLVAFSPNMVASLQQRLVEWSGSLLVLTAEHARAPGLPSTKSRLEWARLEAGQRQEEG